MKKAIIILMILFLGFVHAYSQNISCQELFGIVTSKYDSKETVNC